MLGSSKKTSCGEPILYAVVFSAYSETNGTKRQAAVVETGQVELAAQMVVHPVEREARHSQCDAHTEFSLVPAAQSRREFVFVGS